MSPPADPPPPVASVVVPAHNEEAGLGRLLDMLVPADPASFEVIVVCNGCTDRSAEIAAGFDGVRVIELDEASKRSALKQGNANATVFPRLYVDADIELGAASARRLAAALGSGRYLAAGPRRVIPFDGVSPPVRWYYDVWGRLPQVEVGLFGRGVIALSEAGNERVHRLPALMGDDLAASEAFDPDERTIVDDATVVIHPPRRIRDLYRRRVRAATGNAQADRAGVRKASSVTSPSGLLKLAYDEPRLAPRIAVFLLLTLAARLGAWRAIRSGDFQTWRRDESSRR